MIKNTKRKTETSRNRQKTEKYKVILHSGKVTSLIQLREQAGRIPGRPGTAATAVDHRASLQKIGEESSKMLWLPLSRVGLSVRHRDLRTAV